MATRPKTQQDVLTALLALDPLLARCCRSGVPLLCRMSADSGRRVLSMSLSCRDPKHVGRISEASSADRRNAGNGGIRFAIPPYALSREIGGLGHTG